LLSKSWHYFSQITKCVRQLLVSLTLASLATFCFLNAGIIFHKLQNVLGNYVVSLTLASLATFCFLKAGIIFHKLQIVRQLCSFSSAGKFGNFLLSKSWHYFSQITKCWGTM